MTDSHKTTTSSGIQDAEVDAELDNYGILAESDRGASSHVPTISRLDPGAKRTLYDLKRAGTPANTLKAIASDLRYLNAWHRACDGTALPVPTPPETVLTFVAHHLYDPELRDSDDYGMPAEIEQRLLDAGVKAKAGPIAPSTVHRRLATIGRIHREYDLENPAATEGVREHVKQALRGGRKAKKPQSKSETAATADIITPMLEACEADTRNADLEPKDQLRGKRDRALLYFMWASGGRRRSEAESLTLDCLKPTDEGFHVELRETKTIKSDGMNDTMEVVPLVGEGALAMAEWLEAAGLVLDSTEPVFRQIDRFGRIMRGLSAQSVNKVVKARASDAGYDPSKISAHGLRAGFSTEALQRGMSLADTMKMTTHKDMRSLQAYWRGQEAMKNPAARMLDQSNRGKSRKKSTKT